MKKITAVVALLSAVVVTPVFAEDQGMYAGVTLGQGKPNVTPSAAASSKKSNFIYGGLLGYQYNKNLATEVQFTGFGKATDVAGNTVKGDVLSLSMVGTLPLTNKFELLGKLGIARAKTTSSAGATNLGASRTGLTYGIGVQYNVSSNLGLRLGWDRYAVATSKAGVKTKGNATVMTVGAVYKF
ncbi:MAG: porin family protein [Gallionella sp.]